MTQRSRARWSMIGTALALLLVGGWVISLLMVLAWEERDTPHPASAIVVLGAAQYMGRPSPVLRARLDHAIALWRKGLAPRLLLTGGVGDGDTMSEAEASRRYALNRGVPDSAILIEGRGRTTSESIHQVALIMDTLPTREVILVSDPFHMLRLAILARRSGLEPYTSPTRSSPISASRRQAWKYALGESMKVPFALLFER